MIKCSWLKWAARHLAILSWVGLALCCGCAKKDTGAPAHPPSPVTVATARAADVPVTLETFGRLLAVADVDIKPQVSGRIVEAPFVEGGRVAQGDVLFRIETEAYQAAVDQAAGQLAVAKADLVQAQATLDRNRELLSQSLVSQEDYDKLSTQVDKARGQADLAAAALAAAQVDLERCTIVAPVAGYTGRRKVDVGNVVAPGAEALVNIRDMDKLYLDFTLSESQLPELRQALVAGKVDVLLFAEGAQGLSGLHQGELKLLENTVDTDSGTVMLRALVDNAEGQLWPGQFVYVSPILRTISQAVIVPLAAVAQGKQGPYAYVVQEGKAELRALKQGPVVGDAVVITSGVAADEEVVTAGQLGVWPGAALQIKTEPDEAAKALIERRMADPDVINLIRVLTARGETPDQIGLILGIPADRVQSVCETQGQTQ